MNEQTLDECSNIELNGVSSYTERFGGEVKVLLLMDCEAYSREKEYVDEALQGANVHEFKAVDVVSMLNLFEIITSHAGMENITITLKIYGTSFGRYEVAYFKNGKTQRDPAIHAQCYLT